MAGIATFTEDHPVFRLPDLQAVLKKLKDGDPEVVQLLAAREAAIQLEKEDPYRGVHVLASWERAEAQLEISGVDELLILGGNRSSKSTYAAWKCMRTLVEKPGSQVWCFHTNRENSRSMQQPLIWHFFPKEWKYNHQSQIHNVHYTQKNGFTEMNFVLPNGSQCWFKNYEQEREIIEGGSIDGCWCDELVPFDWIETLRYRILDKRGFILTTFTPTEGYNSTVKIYLQGARVLERHTAEIRKVRGEQLPLVQLPVYKKARIIYFLSRENPFFPYESLVSTVEGSSRSEILCRAYGVPTKARTARFPLFSDAVNVLPASKIPTDGVSRWLFVDPCPGRNWFMMWIAVDVRGRKYVYREWPSEVIPIPGVGTLGPWAEPDGKKPDGKMGPAQSSIGFGIENYIKEILRCEGKSEGVEGEKIQARFMDSRFANSPTMRLEFQTTLIDECAACGMFFQPTPGREIKEGVDLINAFLDYDREKPLEYCNEPHLYVSEECTNTIYALKEWTGEDGKNGACKDPIDCLRYAALVNIFFVDENEPVCSDGGYY
jgi:hypothetical protein